MDRDIRSRILCGKRWDFIWGTELAAFPAGRVGIFKMPEDVTVIRESAFANTKLDKIDMRHCSLISYDEGMFGGTAGCMIMEDEDGV